mgnify:CR=1 FL=1
MGLLSLRLTYSVTVERCYATPFPPSPLVRMVGTGESCNPQGNHGVKEDPYGGSGMKTPSVTELVKHLGPVKFIANRIRREAKPDADPREQYIEVRLHVYDNGTWALGVGDVEAACDEHHRGFLGRDIVGPDEDLREVAKSLLEEVRDHMYIHGEDVK